MMKTRRLKFGAVVVSAMAVLVTAACGSSSSGAATSSSAAPSSSSSAAAAGQSGAPSSAPSSSAQAADTGSGGGAPVTLKIINWVNPGANQAIKTINAEFEKKYPNIKVDYQLSANTTTAYATLLQTTVQSHSADIITTNFPFQPLPVNATRNNMTPEQLWATSGQLLPLDGQPWLKNYTKAALASETYNGHVYGVLSGVYQWMVFYNKDIFKKYNLSPPQTYSQFIQVMDTLKKNGVTPLWLGTGGGAAIYVQEFLTTPLMASVWLPKVKNGNLANSLLTGAERWDSPSFVEAMTKEHKIGSYLEPGYTGVAWQGMPGAFAAGKSAMLIDGSWDLSAVHQANPKINVGSFPLPGSDTAADNKSMLSNDLTFEILKDAAHKDAALKYLEFFSQPDIYKQYVDITGISPSQTSGQFSSYASQVLGADFGKGTSTAIVFPTLSATQGFYCQPANFPALQVDVISGKKTPQQAAQMLQSSCKTG